MVDTQVTDIVSYITIIVFFGGIIFYCVKGFWSITTTLNSNSTDIKQLNTDVHSVRDKYRALRESYFALSGKIEYLDRLWTMVMMK